MVTLKIGLTTKTFLFLTVPGTAMLNCKYHIVPIIKTWKKNIMKRVLSILAMAVFTLGIFSCEAEDTASQDELYIDSPDGDDKGDTSRDS